MQALVENVTNYSVYSLSETDRDGILRRLGEKLVESGHVKESYIDAVCEREKVFPTGLPMDGVGIAIPHADVSHVNAEAMIVGLLEQPVEFQVMGTDDEFVQAEIVFMLAIKDPQSQLEMLQKLVEGCQDRSVLHTLRDHADVAAVEGIIKGFMQ